MEVEVEGWSVAAHGNVIASSAFAIGSRQMQHGSGCVALSGAPRSRDSHAARAAAASSPLRAAASPPLPVPPSPHPPRASAANMRPSCWAGNGTRSDGWLCDGERCAPAERGRAAAALAVEGRALCEP